jgi:hypothetical protein
VRVVLPADPLLGTEQQEVVARLWKRRQTEAGWVYLVGLPSFRDQLDGGVEAVEYRVWVRAPDHVRPVEGVDYDQVLTERLERSPQAASGEASLSPSGREPAASSPTTASIGSGRLHVTGSRLPDQAALCFLAVLLGDSGGLLCCVASQTSSAPQ